MWVGMKRIGGNYRSNPLKMAIRIITISFHYLFYTMQKIKTAKWLDDKKSLS
jgi:hypothetical protein